MKSIGLENEFRERASTFYSSVCVFDLLLNSFWAIKLSIPQCSHKIKIEMVVTCRAAVGIE